MSENKKQLAEAEPLAEAEQPVETEKLVKIRLPIIPGREQQEAQFVRVNDRSWTIPRGVTMEVPECVVEVLNHSEDALAEAMKYQQANMKG